MFKGEELKKVIGAAAYIECSSKTQQVCSFWTFISRIVGFCALLLDGAC